MASRARAEISSHFSLSTRSAAAIHDPPQQMTLGRARYSRKLSGFRPPVGQNRAWGKGPARDFSRARPPAASAGNSLNTVNPWSSPCINSDAVATPGMKSAPDAAAACSRSGVAPGLITRPAPAASTLSSCARSVIVPAATSIPGTDSRTARILSRAASVRRVISMARMPPRCSARASCTVLSTSVAVTTGSTLHACKAERSISHAPENEKRSLH